MSGAVGKWLTQGADHDRELVRRAQTTILGKTSEEVLENVFKSFTKSRKYNLPSGMSVKVLTQALETAVVNESTDGNPYSVWGVANGLTRVSQLTTFADERNFLDRAATSVLGLAV